MRSLQLLIADVFGGMVSMLGALSPAWIVTVIALWSPSPSWSSSGL